MAGPMPQDTPRLRGNTLFVAGDYAAAAAAYSNGINSISPKAGTAAADELATLLANRAACHLELGNMEQAVDDCRACLKLQPLNPKAHYRLARALPPDRDDAGPAIATALAMLEPAARTPAMLETYASIRHAGAASMRTDSAISDTIAAPARMSSGPLLVVQLPEDPDHVTAASNWSEVESALRRGAKLVVLQPGQYTTQVLAPEGRRQPYTLLGVGSVELRPPPYGGGHAVWVTESHPPVTLANLRLVGNGRGAAACASGPNAHLSLIRCRVEDYGEVGLLVCQQAKAKLESCTFTRTAAQAIEVREGGELEGNRLVITECFQGVSAYGGARLVTLRSCVITRSKQEGVLLAGTYTNAATEAQPAGLGPSRSSTARAATEAATAWGRRTGTQLQATLTGCTISHCRQFGVSADSGASVVAQGCRLEENDPYGFFVKGGTDATIAGCLFTYSGAVSRCEWLRRVEAGMPLPRGAPKTPPTRQSGVQVGVNYGGSVTVVGCAFGGREDLGVVEEMTCDVGNRGAAAALAARKLGLWSKPVTAEKNSYHDGSGGGADGLPSLEALSQRMPAWLLRTDGDQGKAAAAAATAARARRPAPAALLQRTSHTFPQSAWAPTAHEFYAIGNTLGYDVTGGRLAEAAVSGTVTAPPPEPTRVLLGACGDIRNLLATAHAVLGPEADTPVAAAAAGDVGDGGDGDNNRRLRRLAFTLNDGNLAMLARDAVLLHMATELAAPPEAVLAVWANHGLTAAQSELLARSLNALAREPWPAWLSAGVTLEDDGAGVQGEAVAEAVAEAERALRGAFAAWASCSMSLSDILTQREERLGGAGAAGVVRARAVELSMEAMRAGAISATAAAGGGGASAAGGGKARGAEDLEVERLRSGVVEYVQTGSLRPLDGGKGGGGGSAAARLVASNPTFLLAPELQYTVYFSSSIFRAVPLGPAAPGASAAERLLATLAPQLATAARALRSSAISVRLVHGDILAVMTTATAAAAKGAASGIGNAPVAETSFDFIDCSNVADYVSMQALVQAAAPLLARRRHSRLRAESFVVLSAELHKAAGCEPSPAAFLESQLCVSLPAFQELTGLSLLGGESKLGRQSGVRLEWAPAEPAAGPGDGNVRNCGGGGGGSTWLTGPRLLLDLLPAAKRLLTPGPRMGTAPALSPLALVHLLTLAAPAAAEPLLRALLRADASGTAELFKWELTLHAALQSGAAASSDGAAAAAAAPRPPPTVRRLTYDAAPGWGLVGRDGAPLLLAFSREALPRGPAAAAAGGPVKQLVTSFAWDEERAVAEVLLPDSISEQCGSWYVTLCAMESGGLVAVGSSARLASLPAAPAAPLRWRRLARPAMQLGSMSLLDFIAAGGDSGNCGGDAPTGAGQWRGVVHEWGDGGRGVSVDVLAPGPLPPAEEAAVEAKVEDEEFVVTVTPKRGAGGSGGARKGKGAPAVRAGGEGAAQFRMRLPAGGLYGKPEAVKLSRKLGLLSARVALLADA